MPKLLDTAVLRLAYFNLRSKKNASFSFGLFILLTVMLLDTALMMMLYLPGFFDMSNERLTGPHYIVLVPNNLYRDEYSRFFENDPRVSMVETEEIVTTDDGTYRMQNGRMLVFPHFFDAGRERAVLPLTPAGPAAQIPEGEGVWAPLTLRQQGFSEGDPIEFELNKRVHTLRIAGFYESTWFASITSNLLNFYLDSSAYQALYDEIGGSKLISVRLHDLAGIDALQADFESATGITLDAPGMDASITSIKYEMMRNGGTMITGLLAALFAAFSAIVLTISVLVIRFRISNYIQDQLRIIGALQAIGYTSGQVRAALLLECALSGLAGGAAGVAAGYGLVSLCGDLLSACLGVRWLCVPHPACDLASLTAVLAVICLAALISTRKVRRLPPVKALRQGFSTHSWRRNVLPLDAARGPLSVKLACKSVVSSLRQYVMLSLILCGVTFSCVFALLMFANLAVDASSFVRLTGEEMGDVMVSLAKHADPDKARALLEERDGVADTVFFNTSSVLVDEETVTLQMTDDFSQLKTASVYEGSFPEFEDEAVITGVLADQLGKGIGDTVTLTRSGVEADYIVCGLTQSISNFGLRCMTTVEGFRRLDPDYQMTTINVYLQPGYASSAFIESLEQEPYVLNPAVAPDGPAQDTSAGRTAEIKIQNLLALYGVDSAQYALMDGDTVVLSGDTSRYLVDKAVDQRTIMESSVGMYGTLIRMLSTGLLILAALIAALILHLVVRASILREKQQFGIYKALGYTSSQLRVQIALRFLPVSVPGIAAGILFGGFFTGPLISALMYHMGISRLSIAAYPASLAALGGLALLFTFAAALLAARPVKKISVYELFTE